MINTRIKAQPTKKSKKSKSMNGVGANSPVVYARTIYNVLVSFEQPMLGKWGRGVFYKGWETIEKTVQVEAYCKEDAHSNVFVSTLEELCAKFLDADPLDFDIQIKRVDELPQAMYMRHIGAPELFAMAV